MPADVIEGEANNEFDIGFDVGCQSFCFDGCCNGCNESNGAHRFIPIRMPSDDFFFGYSTVARVTRLCALHALAIRGKGADQKL